MKSQNHATEMKGNQQLAYFLRKTRDIAFTNELILTKNVYAVLFVMVSFLSARLVKTIDVTLH